MQDMIGNDLAIGDYLLDARGLVFAVRATDASIQKGGVIYTYGVTKTRNGLVTTQAESFVRRGFCLKATAEEASLSQLVRRTLYEEAFLQYRSQEVEAEIESHRDAIRAIRAARTDAAVKSSGC